ncbi:MAG: surface lipoprotein assembly modifier, partial [Burkholderiales bacterium]
AEVGYVLTPRWSVYAGGDVRSRNHRDVKTANYGTLDGRLGVGLNLGQHFLRMGAANGRFFLDRRAYRDTLGGNAEWRYQANDRDQFTFNAQYTSFRLTQEALQTSDFDQAMASLSWLHVLASGSTLFALSVNAGDESPIGRRADGAARINGARVFAQTALTSQIGLFTSLGTQNTKYENVNDTFLLKRDDRLSDITIGLNWRIGKDWSIRPQATYMKNSANIPLYSFTRSDVALNLRKEFH